MRFFRVGCATSLVAAVPSLTLAREFETVSGVRPWVDIDTPPDRQMYRSSRGDQWELVMSDEFNTPGRSFKPGEDHLWTSLEKPDGVNAALEVYSHNMSTTECDTNGDSKTCYLAITTTEDTSSVTVWNGYANPPGFITVTFHYRSAMIQSWNKFCYQGGMLEARVQLPGATSAASGNPDMQKDLSAHATNGAYYPTWPGIWMMGNLGRALFMASTNRMWPFSYNECNERAFNSSNQRISACNKNPGFGLHPRQGRGAPEIDLLESYGTGISSSIQLGPGMAPDFRTFPMQGEGYDCIYLSTCNTKGANHPDIPTEYYKSKRGDRKSWYQGMRYGANNFCKPEKPQAQTYEAIKASVDKGITQNACSPQVCSASQDPHADLSLMDGSTTDHWGINSNATCYPLMNGYYGSFLCSPGNQDSRCDEKTRAADGTKVAPFAYQMDALSANWPIHVAAYKEYLIYQVEWVTGSNGYVRWMLSGLPIYEIPASAIEKAPQDDAKTNPQKIMIEEPLYLLVNVAVSRSWGSPPPNPGQVCRGDGTDAKVNKICDAFPMALKLDYMRLYQDLRPGSNMTIGCDPETHPTKEWIDGHIQDYTDDDNPWVEVAGGAFCNTDDDCRATGKEIAGISTGSCVKNRCMCRGGSWTGPRCTQTMGDFAQSLDEVDVMKDFGPQFPIAIGVAVVTVLLTIISMCFSINRDKKDTADHKSRFAREATRNGGAELDRRSVASIPGKGDGRTNYATNFI